METKHTATPWRVGITNGCVVSDAPVPEMNGSDAVGYYGGHLIGESITPYNAEFIVRACNAHDDLVKALQGSLVALQIALDKEISGRGDKEWIAKKQAALSAAHAALAKAGAE